MTGHRFARIFGCLIRAELRTYVAGMGNTVFAILAVVVSAAIAIATRSYAYPSQPGWRILLSDPLVVYAVVSLAMVRAAYPREYGIIALDAMRGTIDRYFLLPAHIITLVVMEALASGVFWLVFVVLTVAGMSMLASSGESWKVSNFVLAVPLFLCGAVMAVSLSLAIEFLAARRNDIWSVGLIFRMGLTMLSGAWYPLFADVEQPLGFAALSNPLAWVAYHPTRALIGAWSLNDVPWLIGLGCAYSIATVALSVWTYKLNVEST